VVGVKVKSPVIVTSCPPTTEPVFGVMLVMVMALAKYWKLKTPPNTIVKMMRNLV
jgi:hypothetical protein